MHEGAGAIVYSMNAPDFHSLRAYPDARAIEIIDQTQLPHKRVTLRLTDVWEAAHAIRTMQVRGAPLIGATAAYGLAMALSADSFGFKQKTAYEMLRATRPTAVNLQWALDRVRRTVAPLAP